MMSYILPVRTRPRGAAGYTIVIAITVTALLFTAVIGLAAVVLLTVRGTGNLIQANAAYYAAESGVEHALYSMAGHTSGFQSNSKDTSDISLGVLDASLMLPPITELNPRGKRAYLITSRTDALPSDSGQSLLLADKSSATLHLSVDQAVHAGDPSQPNFNLDLSKTMVQFIVDTSTLPSSVDSQPDFRINPYRGPRTDACYFQPNPTGPTAATPNCPGWAPVGVVRADSPDLGLPLTPFNFAWRHCPAGGCVDASLATIPWTARGPGDLPYPSLDVEANDGLLLRNSDLDAEEWGAEDTYLIEGQTARSTGSIIDRSQCDLPNICPMVGMNVDGGDVPIGPAVPLTRLDVSQTNYGPIAAPNPGVLSATGPAIDATSSDDYLYIDTNPPCVSTDPVPCNQRDKAPDGRVSAPWNLEFVATVVATNPLDPADTQSRSFTRRANGLDLAETSATGALLMTTTGGTTPRMEIMLSTLFAGTTAAADDYYPLDAFIALKKGNGYDVDVQLTIATNNRPLRFWFKNSEANKNAPDEKALITIVGNAGENQQTLQTTVFQEETLPVFRRTTVY